MRRAISIISLVESVWIRVFESQNEPLLFCQAINLSLSPSK
jgi:hypothetical protein